MPPVRNDSEPDDPLTGPGLRGWARAIGVLLWRSGRPLLVVQVACALPAVLLTAPFAAIHLHGLPGAIRSGVLTLVLLAFVALAQAASVFLAVREAAGVPTAPSTALRAGRSRVVPLLGWGLIATALFTLGLPLGVLPGLYVAVVAGAALSGVVVVERRGLVRAAGLVNRRLLPTALRCGIGLFAAALYGATAGTLLDALPGEHGVWAGASGVVVGGLVALPLAIAATAFSVACYAELRRRADGVGITDLASALR